MKQWQLTTTRIRTALPQQQTTSQLRELGLRQSEVDTQIFVGEQLCVMLHEHNMLIGGEKLQQECFLTKLSACLPLQDTSQLDEHTPLSFCGKSLEYNRAENSISVHLPEAFYLELLRRYSLEDAPARSTPRIELGKAAPRWTNIILSAEQTKLYKQTVGDLQWSSLVRPDISFAVQQLSNSFMKPTERDEQQLVKVLRYLRGTQHYSISLQPPRRWQKAKNLELLAFSSTSWSGACRSTIGLSLSFMGVPCAASTTTQATTTRAAELASVRMACAQAIHTKSLLQDLQLDQPMSLRVLTGGPLAMQLGLSRKSRHLDLWSRFGQFQLSKVSPQQNLAAALTNNQTASGLHRLLPKLKMHTRSADALALSTGLGRGPAFFRSSSSSFFIGNLRKPPAMVQLVTAEELLGKENEKTINIPELASASISETSLRQKELVATASTAEASLQRACYISFVSSNELTAERACYSSFDSKEELTAERACLAQSLQARELDESFSGSA